MSSSGDFVDTPDFQVEKISDEKLREMALEGSNEKKLVLIQLKLPRQKISLKKSFGDARQAAVREIVPKTQKEEKETWDATEKTRRFLEDMLDQPPRWLNVSGVFLAKVNGRELQKIANFPTVKAIFPNREIRL